MPGKIHLKNNWLISARIDLLFFFVPVLFGLATLIILRNTTISSSACLTFLALQGLGLGPLHMGMSWAHFKDSQIFNHFLGSGSKQILAVTLIATILGFSCLSILLKPEIVIALFLATTIHHIVKQNAGILLLYHNQGECIPSKDIEARTLNISAWFCALIFLARTSPGAEQILFSILAAGALILLLLSIKEYLFSLHQQANKGHSINIPALMFWVLSVLFFLPFAWLVNDYNKFLVAPLVMHWFQYVIVNWVLINRRKTMSKNKELSPASFFFISALFMLAILTAGTIVSMPAYSETVGFKLFTGMIIGLSLIHYAQDAILWRFSNPLIKNKVLQYLKTSPN